MSLIEILLEAVSLAADALAVSIAGILIAPKTSMPRRQSMAISFGAFQGVMPMIGFFIGSLFSAYIQKAGPWVAFGLLAFIGGKMLIESIRGGDEETKNATGNPFDWRNILAMGFATSIDALAVGVTFALEAEKAGPVMTFGDMLGGGIGPIVCSLIIAVVTYLISIGGIFVGSRAGNIFGNRAGIIGGVVLILIGLKILITSFFI